MKFEYDAVFSHPGNDSGTKYISYPHESGPIKIAVSDGVVSDVIQKKITSGRYEKHEAKTIMKIVESGDILLELGAGVGVISTLAWLTKKLKSAHCYEADPRLIPLIQATHRANGVISSIHNVILTSDHKLLQTGSIDFHIREDFYGNSTTDQVGREVRETLRVATRSLADEIAEVRPTVIACDIEGSELNLFEGVRMPSVRRIMLETHQDIIGGAGMRQVFHEMHKTDFHYDEKLSNASVIVFTRID